MVVAAEAVGLHWPACFCQAAYASADQPGWAGLPYSPRLSGLGLTGGARPALPGPGWDVLPRPGARTRSRAWSTQLIFILPPSLLDDWSEKGHKTRSSWERLELFSSSSHHVRISQSESPENLYIPKFSTYKQYDYTWNTCNVNKKFQSIGVAIFHRKSLQLLHRSI
jgi:hypothetical protein